MGEMADLAIDHMFDDEDRDIYDEDPEDDYSGPTKRTAYCKFCKEGGFVWRETPKGWRLHSEKTGQIHICAKYKKP